MLNILSMSELRVELQNHRWPLFRSSSERLCFLLPKEKHSVNFFKHLYKHIVPASYGHGCNTERTASQMRLKTSWWMKGQSCWEGCPWSSVGRHSIWDCSPLPSLHTHHITSPHLSPWSSGFHEISAWWRPHLAQSSSPASASQWTLWEEEAWWGWLPCHAFPICPICYVYFLNFRLHPEICHFNPLQPVILMAAASQFRVSIAQCVL